MKTCWKTVAGCAVALAALNWAVARADQETVKKETKTITTTRDRTDDRDRNTVRDRDVSNRKALDRDADNRFDDKTSNDVLRASEIKGMTVKNANGKDLGKIDDLMLDMGEHGRVRYAALSFGGFLGMGDKLFAVPWSVLEFKHNSDDNSSHVVFDVPEQKLKSAPGFDKHQWPNTANPRWADAVNHHYGVRNEDTAAAATDRATERDHATALHRASEAMHMDVRNEKGDKLGKIEDIVLDRRTGKIRYVALSFGGFLGIGDKFFAIPWQAVRVDFDSDDNEHFLAFDASKKDLENAPGFDKDHWPDFGDRKWVAENEKHFGDRKASAKAKTKTRVE